MLLPPPTSTPFPYTTLFRSGFRLSGQIVGKCREQPGGRYQDTELNDRAVKPRVQRFYSRLICRHCSRLAANGNRTRTKDRKSTRLNSSHLGISYAVFCLKKK